MPYQTVNPFTERLVKTFPEQTDEQLQSIIDQAQDTFSNDWSKGSPTDRKKVLKNVGKLVRERREELAQCITLEINMATHCVANSPEVQAAARGSAVAAARWHRSAAPALAVHQGNPG